MLDPIAAFDNMGNQHMNSGFTLNLKNLV